MYALSRLLVAIFDTSTSRRRELHQNAETAASNSKEFLLYVLVNTLKSLARRNPYPVRTVARGAVAV